MQVGEYNSAFFINDVSRILDQSKEEGKIEQPIEYKITKEIIDHKVNELNTLLEPKYVSIRFEWHEKLHDYYVKVVNTENERVIREIPSKQFLDRYASMMEFIGLLVDEKV